MLSIVGTMIYLTEREDSSFKIMYRDNDTLYNFNPTDIITLTVRERDTYKILMTKVAESLKIRGEDSSVFIFESTDLLENGDYIYDVRLETAAGSRHILIDKAYMHVSENRTPYLPDNEFNPSSLSPVDDDHIYVNTTPLVVNFKYVQTERVEVPGTLIDFDKIINNNPGDEDSDDTLIDFDKVIEEGKEDPEESDDTLILF